MEYRATSLLVEFIPLGIVFVLGAVVYAAYRFTHRRPSKAALANDDYLIFEAEPINLPYLEADLARLGWPLTSSQVTATHSRLYRFEKSDAASASLADIFNFDESMPRTCDRRSGTDSLIRVHGHGSSSGT